MIWRWAWEMTKFFVIDRSEPLKTCQDHRDGSQFPSKGQDGRRMYSSGTQTRDTIMEEPPPAPARSRIGPRVGARCNHKRDIEALSSNSYPPDIDAFARYLEDGEEARIELLFDDLWSSYVHHCDESNRRAMTPRQLQNAWKKVGHTWRDNTAVAPRHRWYVLD
jgi:hypothetical protein